MSHIFRDINSKDIVLSSAIRTKNKDTGLDFAIATDRAQGGSSINDGQLELMIPRR